ncbi:MAG TPA: SIR2 family protein [Longimicrobium sp.]|nr:SIR2 family protein [Longimicrobium sp.]
MAQAPQPLVDDILVGRCLPFIGAGFSMNAFLPNGGVMPDWGGLTRALASVAGVDPQLDGPTVAGAYERLFGRVQLIEAIRRALHSDEAEPGEAHTIFAQLPFDSVYTTNFDLLLETAYGQARRPFRSLVGEKQLPFHGGSLTVSIVKMHGDLRHEEHIIVTSDDYESYLEHYPIIATHLSALLITRTAFFIGYSLTDPDFRNIRDVVRSRLGKFERMAYVITFDATDEEIENRLDDRIHVISLSTESGLSRDMLLANFFKDVQSRLDVEAGTRFRAAHPATFEAIDASVLEESTRETDASALLASSSNLCFVMMPFRPGLDHVYADLIRPAAEALGLTVLRADEMSAPGAITEQIRVAIQQSRVCIADLTGKNPNVLYEVGIAHSLGKPTLLLTQEFSDLPFDMQGLRVIRYSDDLSDILPVREVLERGLRIVLGEDRMDEMSRLIDAGSYRAAVAMLGVLLEHEMRSLLERKPVASPVIIRYRGLGQTLKVLMEGGLIDPDDVQSLRKVVEIRNRAVHSLEEPSAADAFFVLDTVRGFYAKYSDQ